MMVFVAIAFGLGWFLGQRGKALFPAPAKAATPSPAGDEYEWARLRGECETAARRAAEEKRRAIADALRDAVK